jgi:hypothetical protein
MTRIKEQSQAKAATGPKPKRRYSAPKLTEYGHVAKLTAGGSGFNPEGMSGMLGMN